MAIGSNRMTHLVRKVKTNDIPASIDIRPMKQGDEDPVFNFITGVFNQFVAPKFSQEGIKEFLKYIQPDALINHLNRNHIGFIASIRKIVGMIMMRDYNHIALFFVESEHQRKGIGRELLLTALEHCRLQDAKTSQVTVNASPNSITAYKRLNFELMDKEQCVNGIRFIPMTTNL